MTAVATCCCVEHALSSLSRNFLFVPAGSFTGLSVKQAVLFFRVIIIRLLLVSGEEGDHLTQVVQQC